MRHQPELIVLVGMMGAGKSAVGRHLAARLDWTFVDNDAVFEAATGRTARAYATDEGEDAMHAREHELLQRVTDERTRVVVAAPGSIALTRSRDLSRALVVWLQASPPILAQRVDPTDHRPLLGDDPEAALSRLLAERRDSYAAMADLVVDTEGHTPAEVAQEILARSGIGSGGGNDRTAGPADRG